MSRHPKEINNNGVESRESQGGGSLFSLHRFKTFESFQSAAFRIFFYSLIGQWAAMSMQMITRSLLVYRITGLGSFIGIMALAQAIPMLITSFLGGAYADRIQKKYILVVCQAATAVVSLVVAIILSVGYLSRDNPGSWWVLILTAIAQGTVMGFMMPARMAIIPEIVGEDRVMNAVSLTVMGQTVLRLGGPALGGLLVDAYGFAAIYYLMSGMFTISTILALFLPRTSRTDNIRKKTNPFGDVIEGFRYIRRETVFMLIVIFGMCHMIAGQPYQQLLAIFTDDILKVGASGMGILMTASGIGALAGSIILASLPNKKRGILLLSSGIIMSVPLIVFSFSTSWYLSLFLMPIISLGPTIHGTITNTLIQYYADPDYRGRMQSFTAISMGLASIGTFIAGVLADAVGVQWSVGGMAMLLTLITILFFMFSRRLTSLE
ncbi:MFS transporter [Thermodesulfobacteriota bacterium]